MVILAIMTTHPPNETIAGLRRLFLQAVENEALRMESETDGTIDRFAKSIHMLLKNLEMLDMFENRQRARAQSQSEEQYTPYDQLPPPSPEEMQVIDVRLDDIFNRLRRAAIADGLYESAHCEGADIPTPQLDKAAAELSKKSRS